MKIASCVFCFLFGLGPLASAAALPDFSGIWILVQGEVGRPVITNEVRSVVQGPNTQIGMMIKQNKNTLRVENRNGQRVPAQIREYVVDGTERNLAGSQTSRYSAKWDGEKIVIDQNIKASTPFGPADMTTQEVWALSADGKVLTVSRSSQNAPAEMKSTEIYNKAD